MKFDMSIQWLTLAHFAIGLKSKSISKFCSNRIFHYIFLNGSYGNSGRSTVWMNVNDWERVNALLQIKKLYCIKILCSSLCFNAILLTANPSNVHVKTGGGCPFATLNEHNKNNEIRVFDWRIFHNTLNLFTTLAKLLALAVAFARKTNTIAQVMHLDWHFNNEILSIAFKNKTRKIFIQKVWKFSTHRPVAVQLSIEFARIHSIRNIDTYLSNNHYDYSIYTPSIISCTHHILLTLVIFLYFSDNQPWRIGINLKAEIIPKNRNGFVCWKKLKSTNGC